jgi:stalled ribosome alternative rescue factor ArfA
MKGIHMKANYKLFTDKIIERWKKGQTVTDLSKRYHCAPSSIKRVLIEAVGKEEYLRVNKSRTGGGSPKRKANPKYPSWMYEE